MAITGTEVSQYAEPVVQDALVRAIQGDSDLLQFLNVPGNYEDVNSLKYRFWRQTGEDTSIGYRKIGAPFTSGETKLDPSDKHLTICGTHLDVDKVLYQSMGEKGAKYVSEQIVTKLDSLGRKLTRDIISGDANATPGAVNGINKELAIGNQYFISVAKELIDSTSVPSAADRQKSVGFGVNWAAAGLQMNTAANRAILGEFIDIGISRMLSRPDAIVTGAGGRRILKKLMHETPSMFAPLELFGKNVDSYDNIPIIQVPKNFDRSEIVDFNELSPDGTTNTDCTSIYLIKFGFGQNYGAIRNGGVMVSEPKLLDDGVTLRWTVEYLFNHILFNYDSIIRIGGIRE